MSSSHWGGIAQRFRPFCLNMIELQSSYMIKDKSVGIIPVRKDVSGFSFLLIHQVVGHWAFPKGHPNPGETEQETASRELFEETGLPDTTYCILDDFRYVQHYSFDKDGEIIDKEVVFFLGLVDNPAEIKILPDEVQNFAWLSFTASIERLTYKDSHDMIVAAYEHIKRAPAV